MLIETADQYDPERLAAHDRPAPAGACLLAPPTHFQVLAEQNPHMAGRVGSVDGKRATEEWHRLADALRGAGLEVCFLEPREGLSDLCFTANPSLAGLDSEGRPFAVLSRMGHASRRAEVGLHAAWYESRGVRVLDPWGGAEPEGTIVWEGGGDCLWHPGRHFLWAGHGQRSQAAAHRRMASELDVPLGLLGLVDPAFYHLDTCFALLGPATAAWVPEAFDEAARSLLRRAFPRLLEVDAQEARIRLAGNLYCPNQADVFLPSGSPRTRRLLEAAGYAVHEVVLDEFLKSGGSVYCLKQELPRGI